jgi:hypothetical protein
MMRLRLGGLEFVGDVGEATYTVERDGVRGHGLGGADMRRENVDRPAAHGAFSLPGFLTGRSVRWGGLVLTDSMAEQEHALLRLSGLLADGGTSRLTIDGEKPRWLDVQRASPEPPRVLVPGSVASYSFEVWAPDPRMYGEVREFAGGVVAVQYGNFPARPQLIVSGTAASGYTVTGPDGRKVTVTNALTSGAPHTIDFAKGGLYVGDVRQLRAISVYQPWTVGPGLPGVTATVNNGATLIQRVTDTYI